MSTEITRLVGGRPRGPLRWMSDERLTRRAAHGDERALEEVYVRYRQDLYRFCLSLLGDPEDAQDALQNAMVKVLRALPGEEREIRLRPWLYRIARNESVEVIRRRREAADGELESLAASERIADSVEARERLRALLADLRELPERQRAALMMRELGGLELAEIAGALDASEGAVRQTIYEARLGLRQMESGREMTCDAVKRELSDADGRVARRRDLRAHLRGCADCRAFRDGMTHRRNDLAAISPLPALASAALLQSVLGGGTSAGAAAGAGAGTAAAGAGAGGAAAGAGALKGAAGVAGGGILAKSAATVAIVAVVGVSAADRSGFVNVPLPGNTGAEPSAGPTAEPHGPVGDAPGKVRSHAAPAAAGGSDAEAGRAGTADQERGRRDAGAPLSGSSRREVEAPRRQAERAPAPHGHAQGRSGRRGSPQGMPSASQRGQEKASAHRSPSAQGNPGGGKEASKGAGGTQPKARPEGRPEAPAAPAQPTEPAGKAAPPQPQSLPAQGSGGAGKGGGDTVEELSPDSP